MTLWSKLALANNGRMALVFLDRAVCVCAQFVMQGSRRAQSAKTAVLSQRTIATGGRRRVRATPYSVAKGVPKTKERCACRYETRAFRGKTLSLRHLNEMFSNSQQTVCIRTAPLLLRILAVD